MRNEPDALLRAGVHVIAVIFLSWIVPGLASGDDAPPRPAPPRPNIVLMMADDMGFGDTSAYQDLSGNPDRSQVKTRSMEKLARLGIRFSDAHSPSSRCTATRYALLTGRYSWRTRLKYSVIWGPQGDPLIEPDRPTLATLLKSKGYRTAMSGKWHVGLTYRNSSGEPASTYDQADLRQGIADGPLNHGFDFFHGTSRSHPTSAAQGWLSGDRVPAATGPRSVDHGQYVLEETGARNYSMAMGFLKRHLAGAGTRSLPFFLYHACHSNHLKHTPSKELGGVPVAGHSHPGGKRSDFIYENDVALGLILKFLENTDDPRWPGHQLLENTLVIFTSDNGAENKSKVATGPVRSHKGSVYEGGHRVPFIAAWKAGAVGDGIPETPGATSQFPMGLVDLFATFGEIVGEPLPESLGGEDSMSILSALRGQPPETRMPLIHHDHKEAGGGSARNPKTAWLAIRVDNPEVGGERYPGQWKLCVDDGLLMKGKGTPRELYNLADDLAEERNRITESRLAPLVAHLAAELQSIHDRGRLRK